MKTFARSVLLSSAATLCAATALAGSDYYTQALIDLAQGKKQQAMSALEKGVRADQNAGRASRAAALLAFGSSEFVRGPRQVYASMALEQPDSFSVLERVKLLRIQGDGLFERGDLARAVEAYRKALAQGRAAGDLADREYVTYKLGWALMNEGKPAIAFQLWTSWLETGEAGSLRESIARDAGRAWMENALELEQGEGKTLSFMPGDAVVKAAFLDGLLTGIKRQAKPDLTRLARKLGGSAWFAEVSAKALAAIDAEGSLKYCDSLPLFTALAKSKPGLELVAEKDQARWLVGCARERFEGSGSWSTEQKEALATLLKKISLNGINRWAKARVFGAAGLGSENCDELSLLALESEFASSHEAEYPSLVVELTESCGGLTEPSQNAKSNLAALFSDGAARARYTKNSKLMLGAYQAVFSQPKLKQLAIDALIANRALWVGSELALLAQSQATDPPAQAARIFEAFAPVPADQNYSGALSQLVAGHLKAGNRAAAVALLEKYAPPAQLSSPWALRLWMLATLDEPRSDIAAASMRMLGSPVANELSSEDRKATAVMLLKRKDWATIWSNWALLQGEFAKDRGAAESLIAGTIESLEQVSIALAQSEKTEVTTYLAGLAALAAVDSKMPLEQVKAALAAEPVVFRKSRLSKDVKRVSTLRSLENEYSTLTLANDAKLERQLAKRLDLLKRELLGAQKHAWSSELMLSAADQSIRKMATGFAAAIAAVKVEDPELSSQLSQLGQSVAQWRLKP